ncbi:alginate lyase family protein [Lentimicrobium sp. S6]|uniref:alginate lyase family protein n=1 Tax=Lentimicrobium sp. S6 TaxID=2735872 RepID=UPI0015532F40|nr:alginate lyase family protein [Lentimicrobium sp. S6]NPD46731.1 alginate lyase family protein [Lentimicrobium sp. S6]
MNFKIRKAIDFNEELYVFWGVIKKYYTYKNQFYRLTHKRVKKNIKANIFDKKLEKKQVNEILTKQCGDFISFSKILNHNEKNLILNEAEKVVNHEFNLLGGYHRFKEKINWHLDYKSGFEWKKGVFYFDYSQVDNQNNADVKIPREVSRSHHMLKLGQAYLVSGDEKYTLEFIEQIDDWILENPLMFSINWGCAQDVAIRVANWIYALNMFMHSNRITDDFLIKIMTSIYEHGWFIRNNLEKSYKGNANHYDGDLAGLLLVGSLFKDIDTTAMKWYSLSRYQVYNEIRLQILPSGVFFEKSTNYHRLITEFFFYSCILLKRNNEQIPLDIEYRIKSLISFIMNYLNKNGYAPVIGDQDDARYLPFSATKNIDHRYLLSIGAVYYKDSLFKRYSGKYEYDTFFLLGYESKKEYDDLPSYEKVLGSIAYKDAGFYIMRNNTIFLFINNSGQSRYPDDPFMAGSHTHADLLSFELQINGKAFLVDTGSYLYTASPIERNLHRSTKMHNTIEIDGENQYKINKHHLFGYESYANTKLIQWISEKEYDLFEGEHDAYLRLNEGVIHRRRFHFDKIKNLIKITDALFGKGKHNVSLYFHFGELIPFELNNNRLITNLKNHKNIEMIFEDRADTRISKIDSWVSNSYGQREPSSSVLIEFSTNCPVIFETIIIITER